MDAFWKWLMRANARAVCLGLLALLLAVSGFWTWVLVFKPRKLTAPIAAPPPERQKITLGIIDILQHEMTEPPAAPSRSPFFTRYAPPVPFVVTTNTPFIPTPPPPLPPRTNRVVVVTPPPPPPPPPEIITVTYKGSMERPDGILLALFEVKDSKSRRTSFVRRQDSIYGLKVDAISTTGTVWVVHNDGTTNLMRVGNSEQFTENR